MQLLSSYEDKERNCCFIFRTSGQRLLVKWRCSKTGKWLASYDIKHDRSHYPQSPYDQKYRLRKLAT